MHEDDIGKMLAAAAPETVPAVPDLHHRARAMGRRKRTYRNVLTAGGTAVAVTGVVGAALLFGTGSRTADGAGVNAAAGKAAASPTSPTGTAGTSAGTGAVKPGTGAVGPEQEGPATSLPAAAVDQVAQRVAELLPSGYTVKSAHGSHLGPKAEIEIQVADPTGASVGLMLEILPDDAKTSACPYQDCATGHALLRGHTVDWSYIALPTNPTPGSPNQGVRARIRAPRPPGSRPT
ncbi:hypothetical protein ACFQ9X_50400 [Catenulispora yoronensis]